MIYPLIPDMMMHRRITILLTVVCAAVLVTPSAAQAASVGAPANLRVTAADYSSVALSWEPASGSVAYYQILRNGWWVNSSYGTSGSVRYLAAGTTYTFEVRARDWQGNVSSSATVRVTTTADTGPPTTPGNLRVVEDSSGAPVGMAWDSSTDDRGIAEYWLIADGGVVFSGGQSADFFTLAYVECTVFSGETYTFAVRARDLSGQLSATSSTVTVTVP